MSISTFGLSGILLCDVYKYLIIIGGKITDYTTPNKSKQRGGVSSSDRMKNSIKKHLI